MEALKTLSAKFELPPTPSMMEKYDAVVLTHEEKAAALLRAKTEKYWILHDRQVLERKRLDEIELKRLWSSHETYNNALARANMLAKTSGHASYEIDDFVNPVFKLLSLYFSQDPDFEKNGYSLNKGIMLQGNVGVGKTDLLRSFEKNKCRCFATITANEISQKIKQFGADFWRTYTGFIPGHGATKEYFLQSNIGWMIDDMGTENEVNDYGSRIDPIPMIIAERYKLKATIPFTSLHLTTNLNGQMIEERYDYRTLSRIREMFNVIVLNGRDRRV